MGSGSLLRRPSGSFEGPVGRADHEDLVASVDQRVEQRSGDDGSLSLTESITMYGLPSDFECAGEDGYDDTDLAPVDPIWRHWTKVAGSASPTTFLAAAFTCAWQSTRLTPTCADSSST